MRIRGTVLATVGAALLALTACAPSTAGGGDGGDVTLTVLSWRPEDAASYEKIFAVYEKKHPDVKVEFKPVKSTEYLTVLPTELGKSTGGPDVVQLKPYGPIQSLIKSGDLVALDGKVDMSAFPPDTLAAARGREDDKTYGVPFAIQTLQVLYNKKIFAEHGIQPPATWDDMIAASDKLKKAGVIPMSITGQEPWVLALAHQIFGATRYGGDEFAKAVVSGDKDFTDADYVASLELIKQLQPYFPDKVTSVAYPDSQTLFTSGKAAMFPGGSYELAPFKKAAPDLDIGSFEAPLAPGATMDRATTSGFIDGSYGLNSKSKQQAKALELLKWMATPEFGQLFTNELTQISAVPGVTPKDPLLAQMLANYRDHGSQYMMSVHFGYGDPLGRDIEGEGLQKLLNDDGSAQDAANEVKKGIGAWFKPE
jgi:raffinose/stachyose/melibiose transport system substrate-binding protein